MPESGRPWTEAEDALIVKKNHLIGGFHLEKGKIKPDPDELFRLAFEAAKIEMKLAEMTLGEKGALVQFVSASSLMLEATKLYAEKFGNLAIPDMCKNAMKALGER